MSPSALPALQRTSFSLMPLLAMIILAQHFYLRPCEPSYSQSSLLTSRSPARPFAQAWTMLGTHQALSFASGTQSAYFKSTRPIPLLSMRFWSSSRMACLVPLFGLVIISCFVITFKRMVSTWVAPASITCCPRRNTRFHFHSFSSWLPGGI